MRINEVQADHVEELMESYLGDVLQTVMNERINYHQRKLVGGKLSHEEYIDHAAAVRCLEYIRDEPLRLVRKARDGRST